MENILFFRVGFFFLLGKNTANSKNIVDGWRVTVIKLAIKIFFLKNKALCAAPARFPTWQLYGLYNY